jgi:hypothetical protein
MDQGRSNQSEPWGAQQMSTTTAEVAVTFVDNPHAQEIFADAAAGCFAHNGVMRITLINSRVNHSTMPGPINNVVVGRILLPIQMAEAMAKNILQLVETLKAAPTQSPQTMPTIQ